MRFPSLSCFLNFLCTNTQFISFPVQESLVTIAIGIVVKNREVQEKMKEVGKELAKE